MSLSARIARRVMNRALLNQSVMSLSSSSESENPYPSQNPKFKHQEIEGPTVERDTSALANETRESLEGAMKAVYGLSRAAAGVGFVHLGVGLWDPSNTLLTVQSVAAFAFPMSMALVMRRCLKPIFFFKKMEDQARLQILTLTLQSFKHFDQMFSRLAVVAWASAIGLSFGLAYLIFLSFK